MPRTTTANLFAYGTLMCADILRLVTGLQLPGEPGVLRHYRRCRVRGEHYPGLVAQRGEQVNGLVYRLLAPRAWTRLDAFEGTLYRRETVQVVLADGLQIPAQTYVIDPAQRYRLEAEDWELEGFLRTGKAAFCREYRGFRRRG